MVGVYFQRRLENTFDNVKVINILELLFYRSYRYGKKMWLISTRSAHLTEQKSMKSVEQRISEHNSIEHNCPEALSLFHSTHHIHWIVFSRLLPSDGETCLQSLKIFSFVSTCLYFAHDTLLGKHRLFFIKCNICIKI